MISLIPEQGSQLTMEQITEIKSTLDKISESSVDVLYDEIFPEPNKSRIQDKEEGERLFTISGMFTFVKDTITLLSELTEKARIETGGVNAIDIKKKYVWMYQDWAKQKKRQLEDAITKGERDFSDFITIAHRTNENIIDLYNALWMLIPANTYMIEIGRAHV